MSTRQIACVGAGHWGRNLVRNFDSLGSLAVICERDPARQDWVRDRYPEIPVIGDVTEVLGDPAIRGVAVATPAQSHGAVVRAALTAGKDVFVEKPLCLDVREGEELVELADRGGRILMVGHVLWYHAAVRKLKELVDAGELGRLKYVSSSRLNLGRIRTAENILWSFAPHDVSLLLGLVGEMPSDIRTHGAEFVQDHIADVTTSFFTFPSGVRAHILVSWFHPFKEQKLVVVGDEKMAVFDEMEPRDKLVVYPHSIEWRDKIPVALEASGEAVPLELAEPLRTECSHFLECIETRNVPDTDGREALRVLRVLTACQAQLDAVRGDSTSMSAPVPPSATSEPEPPYFVHPSSYVDEGVSIGRGSMVWHFSHLMSGAVVGEDCRVGQNVVIGPRVTVGDGVKIQNNVSVYEGVTLEDHVFCGPSVVFTNVYNPRSEISRMHELRRTLVKRGATLGANCTIVCGVTVGTYALVGAGALVNDDVPDYALVVGNPGRVIGWVCRCGNRIAYDEESGVGRCTECQDEYESTDGGLTPLSILARPPL